MNSDVLNWKCLIRVTVSQTRFDTTKSQAPLRWFVDGFGAVCLSNLFVWVFWQISLHLEVLRQIARRQKLQFFAISRPQIQRFKDSKVEKKFFESKPPKFKDSKVEKKFFESFTWGLGLRFKELLFNLWIFESLNFGGFDSKNFFSTFKSLNLWIFEFWVQ